MTPKQVERIKNKIKKIKTALAADKKYWGGYFHDGQGLRYLPPQLYIQIDDFTGGLRYFNWFQKNFSDDSCYPDFLFEWTIILFKTGRLKEAEKKAFQLFCNDNNFLYKIAGHKKSTIADQEFAESYIIELKNKDSLADFKTWFDKLTTSAIFLQLCTKYIDIKKHLHTEQDEKKQLIYNNNQNNYRVDYNITNDNIETQPITAPTQKAGFRTPQTHLW